MNALKYLGIRKHAKMISQTMDCLGVPRMYRGDFMKNLHGYTRGELTAEYIIKDVDPDLLQASANQINALQQEIQSRRENLKSNTLQTLRTRYHDTSHVYFSESIRNSFPNLFQYQIEIMNKPLSAFIGREIGTTYIKIPLHWHKSVHSKGIAVVKGSDKPRVILSAKPYKLNWLADEGVTAYKVRAFLYKNHNRSVYDAFVMTYSPDGTSNVKAIHENFKRCKSLLNRRINDKVEKSLSMI